MSVRNEVLEPLLQQIGSDRIELDGPRQSGMRWVWRLLVDETAVLFPRRYANMDGLRDIEWVEWPMIAGFLTALLWIGPETAMDVMREETEH